MWLLNAASWVTPCPLMAPRWLATPRAAVRLATCRTASASRWCCTASAWSRASRPSGDPHRQAMVGMTRTRRCHHCASLSRLGCRGRSRVGRRLSTRQRHSAPRTPHHKADCGAIAVVGWLGRGGRPGRRHGERAGACRRRRRAGQWICPSFRPVQRHPCTARPPAGRAPRPTIASGNGRTPSSRRGTILSPSSAAPTKRRRPTKRQSTPRPIPASISISTRPLHRCHAKALLDERHDAVVDFFVSRANVVRGAPAVAQMCASPSKYALPRSARITIGSAPLNQGKPPFGSKRIGWPKTMRGPVRCRCGRT